MCHVSPDMYSQTKDAHGKWKNDWKVLRYKAVALISSHWHQLI